jgi:serine protease DegQ
VAQVAGRRGYPVSGVAWGEGLVVTAHHTLSRETGIEIRYAGASGELAPALEGTLVGRDPTTNLALLQVADGADQPTPLAAAAVDGETPAVGALALALGRPGRTVRAALGIIGAHGPAWRTAMGGSIDAYLEPSLRVFQGFTGGPLLDASGALIGLNTRGLAGRTVVTVPTSTIDRVAAALRSDGHIKRGYLGVSTQQVELPGEGRTGLLVLHVDADGPASLAGLHLGDTLFRFGDADVANHDDLLAELSGDRIGTAVPLTVVRAGEQVTVDVTVGERPQQR